MDKLKNGKSRGRSSIFTEMLKAACDESEFLDLFLSLVHQARKERKAPKEWLDSILVPVHKKGDITKCNT